MIRPIARDLDADRPGECGPVPPRAELEILEVLGQNLVVWDQLVHRIDPADRLGVSHQVGDNLVYSLAPLLGDLLEPPGVLAFDTDDERHATA